MKQKTILYVAQSLDGYISRKDDSLDWLPQFSKDGEDYGYNEFYNRVTLILMGNNTYKFIKKFDKFPYQGKKSFVFSKSETGKNNDIEYTNLSPKEFLESLKSDEVIWLVGGGNLVKSFLEKNLIDEFIITTIPILIGSGKRLFEEFNSDIKLKLIREKSFRSGLVQSTYKKIN